MEYKFSRAFKMLIHCSLVVAQRKVPWFSWIQMGNWGINDNVEFAASLLSRAMGQELSLGFVKLTNWHLLFWCSSLLILFPSILGRALSCWWSPQWLWLPYRKLDIRSGGGSRVTSIQSVKRVYCLLLKTIPVQKDYFSSWQGFP